MISPSNCRASATERAVFPVAVGPPMATIRGRVSLDKAAKLLELGYLDDDAYADMIIEKYAARYGSGRVAEELKKRFLPKEIWEDKLASLDLTEDAYAALCAKARGKDLSDRKEKEKAYGFLVRHGYGPEDIRSAFRRYGQEIEEE